MTTLQEQSRILAELEPAIVKTGHQAAVGYLRDGLKAAQELPEPADVVQATLVTQSALAALLRLSLGISLEEGRATLDRAAPAPVPVTNERLVEMARRIAEKRRLSEPATISGIPTNGLEGVGFDHTDEYKIVRRSATLALLDAGLMGPRGSGLGKVKTEPTRQRFSKVINLSRTSILIDPLRFQNRQGEYSAETVEKILREGYDKSQEPIVVWLDPNDGRAYLLSGHSRYEGARRLVAAGRGKDLDSLPVKVFQGSFEEAQDFALIEANRGGTEEGLKSDVRAYVRAKSQGKDRGYMLSVFKTADRVNTLDALSYLNPQGRFLEYLGEPEERSFPSLARNAAWVGHIRRTYPQLTNSHETELFNYLYTVKKNLAIRKDDFFADVERKVARFDFDPSKPLNMKNLVSGKKASEHLRDDLAEVEAQMRTVAEERARKEVALARWRNEEELAQKGELSRDAHRTRRLVRTVEELSMMNAAILRLAEQRDQLLIDIRRVERDAQFDLFNPAMEPPPPVSQDTDRTAFQAKIKAMAEALLAKNQKKNQGGEGAKLF